MIKAILGKPDAQHITMLDEETGTRAALSAEAAAGLVSLSAAGKRVIAQWLTEQAEQQERGAE